ncbi:site-specific DNA-methyltransferase [Pyruvatibacter sp.]|uniref:DNA-methyltransferase n=1 Tax=Pyruvatibacter sp. TaxID=1981328 RepID=UPI0032EC458D
MTDRSTSASRAPIQWRSIGASARLTHADWLDAARSLAPESIDLLYVDPPFNTGSRQEANEGAFVDSWPSPQAYVAWMRARLEAALPAMHRRGNLLIHVDWRTSHHVRLMLDDLLGADHFVNHLIWSYGLGGSSPRRFARKHDDILFYAIDPDAYWFDPPQVPATSRRMAGRSKKATDVLDVPALNNMAHERVGWPTQKPLALLRMLIQGCCPPDGAVFDPCCGSGTTLVAAIETGRHAVGADINPDAVRVAQLRILQAQE